MAIGWTMFSCYTYKRRSEIYSEHVFWKWSQKTTRSISKVVRGVPLVEHEPLTIPRHLSSTPFELGSFCISLVFSVVFCPFVLFLLVIVLTVLQITASDYPFGIFKRFSVKQQSTCNISLQSDTICWLCAMQSLILLLNDTRLSENQKTIPIM